jgi:hypothetical protein
MDTKNNEQGSVDLSGLTRYEFSEVYGALGTVQQDASGEYVKLADVQALLATKAAQPAAGQVPDARSLHVDQADEPQVDAHGRYFWRAGWNACRDAVLGHAVPPVPAAEQSGTQSIDTPEFRELLCNYRKNPNFDTTKECAALIDHIDAHLARQAQAGAVAVTEEMIEAAEEVARDAGYAEPGEWPIKDMLRAAFDAAPTLGSTPQAEPVAPAILEAISWHARERDDLTLEEAVEAFRHGYKKVRQRSDRAMLLQLIDLMASAPASAAPVAQEGEPSAKPVGEVRLGAHGKLIDWYSSDQDLFALPVGTKVYLAAPSSTDASAQAAPTDESTEKIERLTETLETVRNDYHGVQRALQFWMPKFVDADGRPKHIADRIGHDAFYITEEINEAGAEELGWITVAGAQAAQADVRGAAEDAVRVMEIELALYRDAYGTEAPTEAAVAVLDERKRQKEVEGWTQEHDDQHGKFSMSYAAACYALADTGAVKSGNVNLYKLWQWTGWSWFAWWKPKDRRRNLVRAGALILAEIERIDRTPADDSQPAVGGAA